MAEEISNDVDCVSPASPAQQTRPSLPPLAALEDAENTSRVFLAAEEDATFAAILSEEEHASPSGGTHASSPNNTSGGAAARTMACENSEGFGRSALLAEEGAARGSLGRKLSRGPADAPSDSGRGSRRGSGVALPLPEQEASGNSEPVREYSIVESSTATGTGTGDSAAGDEKAEKEAIYDSEAAKNNSSCCAVS